MTELINDVTRHLTFHRKFLPIWERSADRPALSCGGVTRTFSEHQERVFRLTNALGSELGLKQESRFAVLTLNSLEYMELYHAAYLGGGVINPLNIRLAAKEIAFILNDSGTEAVFVDAMFAPLVEAIRDSVDSLRSVLLIGGGAPDGVRIDAAFDDLIAAGSADMPPETDEGDMACLMYTGGTTGLPKGVVHTQRSHAIASDVIKALLGEPGDDSHYLLATPLFHAASQGAITTYPASGAPVTIVNMFTPAGVIDAIEQSGATDMLLVPVMIRMMIDDPSFSPDRVKSLKNLSYGGSPMPLGVLERVLGISPELNVLQAYGMTEGLPVSCLDTDAHRKGGKPLTSAGTVVTGVEVSIQSDDGTPLPQGEVGEVCARGGMYLKEYWNRPEETAAALAGGWYHTGDVGYFDDEGHLYLVDRAKDMIVSGGENIYTSEVESAISTHAAVADVAVIGIPSEQWGEAVHAIVVVREGAEATEEEIVAHARESIAGYKVPRSVEFRTDPLPVSGAGKTLKRELRAPFWGDGDRQVN